MRTDHVLFLQKLNANGVEIFPRVLERRGVDPAVENRKKLAVCIIEEKVSISQIHLHQLITLNRALASSRSMSRMSGK